MVGNFVGQNLEIRDAQIGRRKRVIGDVISVFFHIRIIFVPGFGNAVFLNKIAHVGTNERDAFGFRL